MPIKKWDPNESELELLRARFTLWLDKSLSRASARFRDQMRDRFHDEKIVMSIDAFPSDYFPDPSDPYEKIEIGQPDFYFEEERLAKAFSELPLMKREVLRPLFVEQKTCREIAGILQCSEQFVSVQKRRALSKLRKVIEGRSNGDV